MKNTIIVKVPRSSRVKEKIHTFSSQQGFGKGKGTSLNCLYAPGSWIESELGKTNIKERNIYNNKIFGTCKRNLFKTNKPDISLSSCKHSTLNQNITSHTSISASHINFTLMIIKSAATWTQAMEPISRAANCKLISFN